MGSYISSGTKKVTFRACRKGKGTGQSATTSATAERTVEREASTKEKAGHLLRPPLGLL